MVPMEACEAVSVHMGERPSGHGMLAVTLHHPFFGHCSGTPVMCVCSISTGYICPRSRLLYQPVHFTERVSERASIGSVLPCHGARCERGRVKCVGVRVTDLEHAGRVLFLRLVAGRGVHVRERHVQEERSGRRPIEGEGLANERGPK